MEREKVSVHRVVDWVLRCGDIDSRYADETAMWQGAAAHRKIQKAMGEDYRREVPLSIEAEAGGCPLLLQGRADGIFPDEQGVPVIDEIKSTTLPLDKLAREMPLHLGQAKCYAAMYLHAQEEPPDAVGVQLTYIQLDTEEVERRRFTFTRGELDAFFADLMERWGVWVRFRRDWREARSAAIAAAPFPYPAYRPGQRPLAAAVYRTIAGGRRLYVQAPTGTGKTLSTLFPACKALGEGKLDRIFYLTAKTVTRTVAEEAAALLRGAGMRLKSVTLRAKEKICFCVEPLCNPDACPCARGHYDRVNGALLALLSEQDGITPAIVEEYARKHSVCPYELALDACEWADLVIGDYNHVFDPTVYLRRFFDGENEEASGFLIDEAHNLADRVRDMYSATLRKSAFSHLARELKGKGKEASALRRAMGQVNRYLLDAGRELGEETERAQPEADAVLNAPVLLFCQAAEAWLPLGQAEGHPLFSDLLALYFEADAYRNIASLYDGAFVTLTEKAEGEVTITQFCLDPTALIAGRLEKAKAAVLFSATLTPLPYYRDILGGRPDDPAIQIPSPFDPSRLLLVAHGGISTKYQDRQASLEPLARTIEAAVSHKKGNYLVFFPSYAYMQEVLDRLEALPRPDLDIVVQESGMTEEERAAFLARFDADNPRTLVGFCVLGGLFSEGIDLKGDRLIGAIVVGVGLPGLSLRQNQIRDYYQRKNGRGYDYAYVFPGMNKVLQAAGRVIRSDEDAGLVLLIDSRFPTPAYRALFPPHWGGIRFVRDLPALQRLLDSFPYFRDL